MAQEEYSFMLEDGDKITKLIVRHGAVVDSLGFVITDKDGSTTTKVFNNVSTGIPSEIVLGPEEYITQISGTYGLYLGAIIISTMVIQTNSNQYGPFGAGSGTEQTQFSTPSPLGGTIIGFFGSSGAAPSPYLASIGIYAKHGPYGRTS